MLRVGLALGDTEDAVGLGVGDSVAACGVEPPEHPATKADTSAAASAPRTPNPMSRRISES